MMKVSLSAIFPLLALAGCTADREPLDTRDYPADIGSIVLTQCAVTGCHNDKSREATAGLSLETWESLFEGSRNNAAVVPYRPDQSFLMFYINTYAGLGPSAAPTMPYGKTPLSRGQVDLFRTWIAAGAPNKSGAVKFSGDAGRKKIYIANQGCDLIAVMDLETQLVMRYMDAGSSAATESPHFCDVSADGKYFYACLYSGSVFQRFSAEGDVPDGQAVIGTGSWNTFVLSPDGTRAYVVDWNPNGKIAVVDLQTMSLLTTYQGAGLLVNPHGSAMRNDNTLYVTAQTGNFLYKVDVTDVMNPSFEKVVLQTGELWSTAPKYDPHEIRFSPDGLQYAVTCQRTNEVRFFRAADDSLLAAVPVGVFPQELAFSPAAGYLFVTCPEDNVTFPGKTGSVAVIDYATHQKVTDIYTGHQPHGLAVDDEKMLVYVANRNAGAGGPAPHHTTDCGGRNGYLTIIDVTTLSLVPGYRAELSVDPYGVALRK